MERVERKKKERLSVINGEVKESNVDENRKRKKMGRARERDRER